MLLGGDHQELLGGCSHNHPGASHPLLPDGRLRLDKPADSHNLRFASQERQGLKFNCKLFGQQKIEPGLF